MVIFLFICAAAATVASVVAVGFTSVPLYAVLGLLVTTGLRSNFCVGLASDETPDISVTALAATLQVIR